MDVKSSLAKKAEQAGTVKLNKGMNIADMIKALEPEIKKALPSVITPERFTRMALSAINNTPKLAECTQMSFLAALMNAAQLGLEPNTPLGQAYLIPFNNKGVLECQFQLGYKGLINLAYRNDQLQTIQAQCVYSNDQFTYELGLESKLFHKPAIGERGEMIAVYALFKLKNGGYGFEVMSKQDVDTYAQKYSKAISSSYSPWQTAYTEMAKPKLETDNMNYDFTTDVSNVRERKPKRKKIFKKVIKFFTEVVRPVLTFIPLYINALANYKRAKSLAC